MKRTPLRRKAKPSRYNTRKRESDYMLAVKQLPCYVRELAPLIITPANEAYRCDGPVEADHDSRGRGLGQKSPDSEVIPLCTKHHGQRTSFSGVFARFKQADMRGFLEEAIARTQREIQLRGIAVPS